MTAAILTPTFTVAFPCVFEISKHWLSMYGKEVYSIQMNFDKSDVEKLKEIKGLIDEAIKEKWGSKPPKNLTLPDFKDGAKMEHESLKNSYILNVKSFRKPKVEDQELNEITSKELFYAGCKARAFINAYAYDKASNGVNFGLIKLQKVAEGKQIGYDDSELEFEKVEAKDMSDDIPF